MLAPFNNLSYVKVILTRLEISLNPSAETVKISKSQKATVANKAKNNFIFVEKLQNFKFS